jgi:hypothetical protein
MADYWLEVIIGGLVDRTPRLRLYPDYLHAIMRRAPRST